MSTNSCESLHESMMEVLYEEAGDEVRSRIEAHLATCENCREELAGLRQVRGELQAAAPPLPETRPARLVLLGRPPVRPWIRAMRWATAAAVASIALLGILQARVAADGEGFEFSFGGASAQEVATQVRGEIDAALASVRADSDAERQALLVALQEELLRRDETAQRVQNATLRRLATDLEELRREDIGFVMSEIGLLEQRTGLEMRRTQDLLRHAVVNASLTEDR